MGCVDGVVAGAGTEVAVVAAVEVAVTGVVEGSEAGGARSLCWVGFATAPVDPVLPGAVDEVLTAPAAAAGAGAVAEAVAVPLETAFPVVVEGGISLSLIADSEVSSLRASLAVATIAAALLVTSLRRAPVKEPDDVDASVREVARAAADDPAADDAAEDAADAAAAAAVVIPAPAVGGDLARTACALLVGAGASAARGAAGCCAGLVAADAELAELMAASEGTCTCTPRT